MGIKGGKASELRLAYRKVLVPAAFFSLLQMQVAFLRLIEDLRDEFRL